MKKNLSTTDEAYKSSMLPLLTGGVAGIGLLVGGAFAAVGAYENMTSDAPPAAHSTQDPPGPSSTPASPSDAPGDKDETKDGDDRGGDADADDKKGTADDLDKDKPQREVTRDEDGMVYETHAIVWGDTLSQISLDTGISVDRLAEYNSIPNPDLIYAGSALRVPSE